jgi:hypothetical protein
MIDFMKRLNKFAIGTKFKTIEIYESFERKSIAGLLRQSQNKIL